ncbi:MAG: class I SAM-dependent methyltransferase [Anaerolineae bacterium]
MRIPILYQDDDIVVIDKPAGLPTHAADPRDPYPGDALQIVRRQAGLAYLGMHQRLDADTSGVMLFSVRHEANKALAAAFEGRSVHKIYLALVWGTPPKPEGFIDAAIVRGRNGRYRVASSADLGGQSARTRYRVLDANAAVWPAGLVAHSPLRTTDRPGRPEGCSLLEVIPETGRPHQIRVHLAHIGCPVVGDPLYGPPERFAPRLCLHAYQLTLPHPTTGRPMTFTAPPPFVGPALAPQTLALVAARTPVRDMAGRNPAALRALLQQAVARRSALADDPEVTIYRLVNGAADGLVGLTVDRYGDGLVASIYEDQTGPLPRPLPETLWSALLTTAGTRAVYVRYRPRQASRLSEAQMAALAPARPVSGSDLGPAWTALEEGLVYQIRPGEGLSVGLFPDMREGRARVRAWAAGRRVLNCFAYTCGFGLAAMAGGAARVLNLDLSKAALAWGQENYRANGFAADPYDFVFGDAFDWLQRFARRQEHFDMVILDPPGFARTKERTFSAAQDYDQLVALAARVTGSGGLLLACCNVAELPWRAFRARVLAGIAAAGRRAEITGIHHEPALDFPTLPGQEPYLKMVWLQL